MNMTRSTAGQIKIDNRTIECGCRTGFTRRVIFENHPKIAQGNPERIPIPHQKSRALTKFLECQGLLRGYHSLYAGDVSY